MSMAIEIKCNMCGHVDSVTAEAQPAPQADGAVAVVLSAERAAFGRLQAGNPMAAAAFAQRHPHVLTAPEGA